MFGWQAGCLLNLQQEIVAFSSRMKPQNLKYKELTSVRPIIEGWHRKVLALAQHGAAGRLIDAADGLEEILDCIDARLELGDDVKAFKRPDCKLGLDAQQAIDKIEAELTDSCEILREVMMYASVPGQMLAEKCVSEMLGILAALQVDDRGVRERIQVVEKCGSDVRKMRADMLKNNLVLSGRLVVMSDDDKNALGDVLDSFSAMIVFSYMDKGQMCTQLAFEECITQLAKIVFFGKMPTEARVKLHQTLLLWLDCQQDLIEQLYDDHCCSLADYTRDMKLDMLPFTCCIEKHCPESLKLCTQIKDICHKLLAERLQKEEAEVNSFSNSDLQKKLSLVNTLIQEEVIDSYAKSAKNTSGFELEGHAKCD